MHIKLLLVRLYVGARTAVGLVARNPFVENDLSLGIA